MLQNDGARGDSPMTAASQYHCAHWKWSMSDWGINDAIYPAALTTQGQCCAWYKYSSDPKKQKARQSENLKLLENF